MRIAALLLTFAFLAIPTGAQNHPASDLAFSVTSYYTPIFDHRGFWRHGISAAAEVKLHGWSAGPRLTAADVRNGEWYGRQIQIGAHFSRHFGHGIVMPHLHVEAGHYITHMVAQSRKESGPYAGIGGSLGWNLGPIVTLQIPQYTHTELGHGHRQEALSVGITIRFQKSEERKQ